MHGIGHLNLPYDDDEPVYDRLMSFDTDKVQLRRPKSPRFQKQRDENVGYTRVRRTQRAVRESVVQFADDLMERGMGRGWQPEAMEHTIDVVSSQVHTHVTTSTTIPRPKPQTAESLASLRNQRRAGSVEPRRPKVDVSSVYVKEDVPLTPGQVHELAKRFSFSPASTPTTGTTKTTPSRIPVATSSHTTPMKATTSTAQMTKPGTPVRPVAPADKSEAEMQLRSNKRSVRMRPASWDASLIFNGEKADAEASKDDSTSEATFEESTASQSFTRNSNIRAAFRRKSQSREFSPEPPTDNSTTQAKEKPPATGAPETMTTTTPTKRKEPQQLSQGSGSSQEEKENVSPMSVRERTIRWEARGGGLPSYLTMPRPRKLKSSTSGSNQSSKQSGGDVLSPTERERSSSTDTAKSRHSSLSAIPQPTAGKVRSPRSSSTKAPSTSKLQQAGSSVSTSRIPSATSKPRSTSGKTSPQLTYQEEADGGSNPVEPLQKGTETEDKPQTVPGDEVKTSGAEKCGGQNEAETVSSGHKPVIMKGVSASSGKSRGQSLLPTRTQIPTITHIPVSFTDSGHCVNACI